MDGKLPSESQLVSRFGVNRHTVRQALAWLQTQALVRVEPGKGTFVCHEWLGYPLSNRTRFSDNLNSQGRAPSKQLLTACEGPAPERVRQELQLQPSEQVLVVETLDQANGEPVGLATSYYPAQRFAGLLEMLSGEAPMSHVLSHFGVTDYLRAVSRVTTRMPTPAAARLLRQSPDRPVLCVESLDVDPSHRPIKFGETLFSGDRVQLSVSLAHAT